MTLLDVNLPICLLIDAHAAFSVSVLIRQTTFKTERTWQTVDSYYLELIIRLETAPHLLEKVPQQ